jgi:hypothetical protein
MRKSIALIAAGAVTLSAALAVISTHKNSNQIEINPTDVMTWDCEYPAYKPESIMLTCADGGWLVHKIKWKTWTTEAATGSGYFSENLCEPSCAEGKRVEAPVDISLSDLTPYKKKFYLRTLDIQTKDGRNFPWGRSGQLKWDVMEFGVMMDAK